MEKLRLLYIEDDDKQRKTLAVRLRSKGFKVTVAKSGKTGLNLFKNRTFEAILCDLHMPEIGGEKVLDIIRQKDKDIPFIILSAHGTISKAVKTIKKGADHFIRKPGDINEIIVSINQTIEKKKLREKLANSQATLQMVTDNVPDIIYSLNTKGEFLSLSPAVKPSMGYKPEELLGTSVFNVIHPDDRQRVLGGFIHAIKTGEKEVRNLSFRMISKSGEVRHFEVSRRLIFEKGRVIRIDGIVRDDTERVILQNKLEKYSHQLEQMVEERTESLKYVNRQLSALSKVSNKFIKIFDEEKLFDQVASLLTQTLDFDRAYLILLHDKELQIRSWCPGTGSRKTMENYIKKFDDGTVKLPPHINESLKKGKTIFVPDIKADRRWPKGPKFLVQAKSVVISPIRSKQKVLGVIVGSLDDHERNMNRQDVERFEMFANMVGLTLDNIRAYQSMEQKVVERTESLNKLNIELEKKAEQLEESRVELAYANVDLLAAQENLQSKNEEMEKVLNELSRRSKELQIIIDSGPNIILLVDVNDNIQVVNKLIADYFGIKQESIIGKSFDYLIRKIRTAFENPEKLIDLLEKLKRKPDIAGQLDLSEFYSRGVSAKGSTPLIIAPVSICVLDEDKKEIGRVWMFTNITKIKQAEEQVHAIVRASPIPTIISRVENGQIIYVNEQLASLIGSTPDDLIGKYTPDFYNRPEDRKKVLEALQRDGFLNDFEMQIKRIDGSVIWVLLSLVFTEIAGEKVILGGLYDISERKKAEEAIAARLRYEEGLALLSQTLLTGVERADSIPKALSYLLEAARASRVYIFENFEDETDGLCMRQIHEACAPGVESQIDNPMLQHFPYSKGPDRWRDSLLRGEPIKGVMDHFTEEEKKLLQPPGIISILCIPIKVEGKWYGFIGFDDVTEAREWSNEDILTLQTAAEIIGIYIEHHRFEETLRVSEERFRNLVENANEVIYSLTPKGEFSYISPKFTEDLGYEVVDFIGQPFFPLLHPDDVQMSKDWFKSGLQHEEHREGYEFRMVHKDGSIRWFTTNASLILDENGDVLELIGVAHDITQMKKVLEEIEKANRHLKETQAQLAQSEKMASLGMLVAGIAHEINTPIGAVNSMHDTLIRSLEKLKGIIETNFSKEHKESSKLESILDTIDDSNKIIKTGTERVTTIVRRLRSFARLDEAELKTVDIHEGLEDTLTLIHHEIKHDIALVKNYGEIPLIACFPGQLNQVFLNILVNARQAIIGKGEISITTFSRDKKVFVKIKDTGRGIAKEYLSKVFDPGFTTKGVGVGTGLGLAICYKIIQDHKGEITVESELGQGSTFTVILPTDLDSTLGNNLG